MTLLGTDISSYQNGLSLADLAYSDFVIAKCSEGTYYHDGNYGGWRSQAGSLKKPFAWYHFLTDEDPQAQFDHCLFTLGGEKTLPGMLDVEPTGYSRPDLNRVLAFADIARANGLNLRLVYLPHWYWVEIGSPSLTPLTDRGLILVASAYPGGTGSPTQLYPGDDAIEWEPYGGVTPGVYQYTNQATDAGRSLDYNAIRYTSVYDAIFKSNPTGDTAMGTIPASIGQKWPDIASEFPANATFDSDNALIWADGGARAAALYAKEAVDAVNALSAKISPAALGPQIAAAIDVNALATAISAHMTGVPQFDSNTLANVVVAHLAAQLSKP